MKLKIIKVISAIFVCSTLSYVPTTLSFGLKDLTSGGKSGGAAADPDSFLKSANEARDLMQNSLGHMTKALLSKEKAAEFKAKQDAANAATDPAEKEAKNSELVENRINKSLQLLKKYGLCDNGPLNLSEVDSSAHANSCPVGKHHVKAHMVHYAPSVAHPAGIIAPRVEHCAKNPDKTVTNTHGLSDRELNKALRGIDRRQTD